MSKFGIVWVLAFLFSIFSCVWGLYVVCTAESFFEATAGILVGLLGAKMGLDLVRSLNK